MEPRLAGVRAARRSSFGDHLGARGSLLALAGTLVIPCVVVGYLGVAGLLVLPLLALRGLFPRRPALLTVSAGR